MPDPAVSYEAGIAASEEGDFAAAADRFSEAAQLGHPQAQVRLAQLYESGKGVARSDAEAARLYQLAAEQGHPVAQDRLGDFYSRGQSVPED
ncbi:MAG TPA: tetratricopeptide repeat protein, partial [Kiloniellaceae bacterium]|nr:tetratricopeptide repeat protein [Kiloniellaceae bacterium]